MHEELFHPEGIFVEDISLLIRAYVNAVGKDLPVLYPAEGILEVGIPAPERFDLGAGKLYSRLVGLLDKEVVICFFVLRDDPRLFFLSHNRTPFRVHCCIILSHTAVFVKGQRGGAERIGC